MTKLPEAARRWAWRLAVAAALLSLAGYFSTPMVAPLMCKIWG